MNIFKRELRANRKSIIIWCICIVLFLASGMAKYQGTSLGGQSINDIINKLPRIVQAVFGTSGYDLSKASGYYGLMFQYMLLLAAIFAATLGTNAFGKEEADKTAEFLFTKPVSRNKIILSKFCAVLFNIIIFDFATLISSILLMNKLGKGENINKGIFTLTISMFIIQLLFASFGAFMAAISTHPKNAASSVTAVITVTYFFSIAVDFSDKLDFLKYFTPFKYFVPKDLIYGGSLNILFLVISLIVTAALLIYGWNHYTKKDLKI